MHSNVQKIKVVTHVTKKRAIVIIEMKSQSKMTITKLSFITSQRGAAKTVAPFCMEKGAVMEKPLIGATPDFIVIPRRNVELAEAILKYSEKSLQDKTTALEINCIKRWATEIVGNCDTQLKIIKIANTATSE